jgi:hypothetical protein
VVDAKCDLLLYGNAERALVEVAHRLAAREPVHEITDVRGTAFVQRTTPEGWFQIDSSSVDTPGRVEEHINPYMTIADQAKAQGETCAKEEGSGMPEANPAIQPLTFVPNPKVKLKVPPRDRSVIRLSVETFMEQLRADDRLLHVLLREGTAGSDAFKHAVDRELNYFEDELRVDLIRLAAADGARLHEPALASKAITRLVFAMGATAVDLPPEKDPELIDQLTQMLRMIITGARTLAGSPPLR